MRARLLGAAALLLAATTPASAVNMGFVFSATPNVVEQGSSVELNLYYFVALDPGYIGAYFFQPPSVTFYDGMGNSVWMPQPILTTPGEIHWTFTYPEAGTFLASWRFASTISQYRNCTGYFTCDPIRHTSSTRTGQTEVVVVPGPAVGAGLPALMMLLALWQRWRRQ